MSAMPQHVYDDIATTLANAQRMDLVAELQKVCKPKKKDTLTSGQAAKLLGVSSTNTVKNWLESGFFPGAFKTAGGHWRFLRHEVLAVRERMELLRKKDAQGDLTPVDHDDALAPPLL